MNLRILSIPILLLTAPAYAQDALVSCAEIADSSARLACYDKAMQANKSLPVLRLPRNTTNPASSASGAAGVPVSSGAADNAGTPAVTAEQTSTDDFGLEIKTGNNSEEENTRIFTVANASYNKFTGWSIEFTNGQVWKQIGADSYTIAAGQSYIISRGTFNSFFLNAEGQRNKIRITRSE